MTATAIVPKPLAAILTASSPGPERSRRARDCGTHLAAMSPGRPNLGQGSLLTMRSPNGPLFKRYEILAVVVFVTAAGCLAMLKWVY